MLFFTGILACLYLAFSPTVTVPYVQHDAVRYFHKFFNADPTALLDPYYKITYDQGRPLMAEMETLVYKSVNHLSDLAHLRLMTIAVLAFSASLLGRILVSSGIKIVPAFCLSVAVFTLPGVQDFIFTPSLGIALAVFLSLLAYTIWIGQWTFGIRFTLAYILLEAAFLTYQPTTLFFLVPTALIMIFQNDWQIAKKIWVRDILLWVLAAVIYYLALRIFFYGQVKFSGHEIAFTYQQVWQNVMSFLPRGVGQTFNLWNVYYSRALGILMMLFVLVPITIDLFVTQEIGLKRLSALLVLFLVFNLVWFLFGGYMPREFIGSQALALGLVYWSGRWILRKTFHSRLILSFWPIVFMLIGLLSAHITMKYDVLNANSELMFIRSQLAKMARSSTKEIHFIRAKDISKGYNGLPTVYDNLNGTSVGDNEVSDLIRAALKDSFLPAMYCVVTATNYYEHYQQSPNSIVIDMNDLAGGVVWKKYISRVFDSPKDYHPQSTVIYPNDVDYIDHGVDYEKQNNFALALANYEKAIEINPNFAKAYYDRGVIYLKQDNLNLALADFEKAIELNPGFDAAYNNRGIVYLKQGRLDLALADFGKAVEINPGYVEALVNRGFIYGNQGHYDQAIVDFGKAITINPDLAGVYNERATCYFYIKDFTRAWRDVRKAQALGSNVSPELLNNLKAVSGLTSQ